MRTVGARARGRRSRLNPLVIHTAAARDVFVGFIGLWVAIELISQIPLLRQRVGRRFDPTRLVVAISLFGGFVLAVRAVGHRFWMFGGGWPSIGVGLGIASAGFFSYDVTIQPGHRVVTAGPYRWVRHPSYTGGLVGLLGLGIALGSVAAVLALVLVPLIGVLIRIQYEERTLRSALGTEYTAYAAHTPRLIPGIW
jgi:protein-S-isoprenylcysteine O-methyltransferase Ste14